MGAFARQEGTVYHAYSAYERGLDALRGHAPVAMDASADEEWHDSSCSMDMARDLCVLHLDRR